MTLRWSARSREEMPQGGLDRRCQPALAATAGRGSIDCILWNRAIADQVSARIFLPARGTMFDAMSEKFIIRSGHTLSVPETAEKYGATRAEVERLRELVSSGSAWWSPTSLKPGDRAGLRKSSGASRKRTKRA